MALRSTVSYGLMQGLILISFLSWTLGKEMTDIHVPKEEKSENFPKISPSVIFIESFIYQQKPFMENLLKEEDFSDHFHHFIKRPSVNCSEISFNLSSHPSSIYLSIAPNGKSAITLVPCLENAKGLDFLIFLSSSVFKSAKNQFFTSKLIKRFFNKKLIPEVKQVKLCEKGFFDLSGNCFEVHEGRRLQTLSDDEAEKRYNSYLIDYIVPVSVSMMLFEDFSSNFYDTLSNNLITFCSQEVTDFDIYESVSQAVEEMMSYNLTNISVLVESSDKLLECLNVSNITCSENNSKQCSDTKMSIPQYSRIITNYLNIYKNASGESCIYNSKVPDAISSAFDFTSKLFVTIFNFNQSFETHEDFHENITFTVKKFYTSEMGIDSSCDFKNQNLTGLSVSFKISDGSIPGFLSDVYGFKAFKIGTEKNQKGFDDEFSKFEEITDAKCFSDEKTLEFSGRSSNESCSFNDILNNFKLNAKNITINPSISIKFTQGDLGLYAFVKCCGEAKGLDENNNCEDCRLNCNCKCAGSCDSCSSTNYYIQGSKCFKCPDGCKNCSFILSCTECENGYYLDAFSCKKCQEKCSTCENYISCKTCSNGYYRNQENNDCLKCNESCSQCNNKEVCTKCSEGFFINESTCSPCIHNCKVCSKKSKCDNCKLGYYLLNDNLLCGSCSNGCKKCTNTESCNECDTGFFLENPNCTQCGNNCSECSNATFCTLCHDGFYLKDSICTACEDGKYLNEYKSCSNCSENCKTCKVSTNCTSCEQKKYLSPANRCLDCSNNCLNCNDNSTCDKCDDGYFLNSISNLENKCTNCHDDCKTCVKDKLCNTCRFKNMIPSNSEGCSCIPGMYRNKNECYKCNSSCLTCKTENNCTSCKSAIATLNDGICYCPSGFFNDTGICISCRPRCKTCTKKLDCTECSIIDSNLADDCKCYYEIINGVCKCQEDYFMINKKCVKCESWINNSHLNAYISDSKKEIIVHLNKTITWNDKLKFTSFLLNNSTLGINPSEKEEDLTDSTEFTITLGDNSSIFINKYLEINTTGFQGTNKICNERVENYNITVHGEEPHPVKIVSNDTMNFSCSTKDFEIDINIRNGFGKISKCEWSFTPDSDPVNVWNDKYAKIQDCKVYLTLNQVRSSFNLNVSLIVQYGNSKSFTTQQKFNFTREQTTTLKLTGNSCVPSKFCEIFIDELKTCEKTDNLKYIWKDDDNNYNDSNSSTLRFEAFTKNPITYNYSLIIKSDDFEIYNEKFTITFKEENFVIVLDKSNGDISSTKDFILDASESYDPNFKKSKNLSYNWTVDSPDKNENGSKLEISKDDLSQIENITINLVVTSLKYTNKSENFTFFANIINENISDLSIVEEKTGIAPKKIPKMTGTVFKIKGDTSNIKSINWFINDEKLAGYFTSFLKPDDHRNSTETYKLKLELSTFQINIEFIINSPPIIKAISIKPNESIEALTTEVKLAAADYDDPDEDFPYLFVFTYASDTYKIILKTSNLNYTYTTLNHIGDDAKVFIRIYDSLGDYDEKSESVSVNNASDKVLKEYIRNNSVIEPSNNIPNVLFNVLTSASSIKEELGQDFYQEVFTNAIYNINKFIDDSITSDVAVSQSIDLLIKLTYIPAIQTDMTSDKSGNSFNETLNTTKSLMNKLDNGINEDQSAGLFKILNNIIVIDDSLINDNSNQLETISNTSDEINVLTLKNLKQNNITEVNSSDIISILLLNSSSKFDYFVHESSDFSVEIPENITNNITLKYGVSATYFKFKNFTSPAAGIVSLSIYDMVENKIIKITESKEMIKIKIKVNPLLIENKNINCVYLDENQQWNTDGCKFDKIINETVVCKCSHLSVFTITTSEKEEKEYLTILRSIEFNKETLKSYGFLMVSGITIIYLITIFIVATAESTTVETSNISDDQINFETIQTERNYNDRSNYYSKNILNSDRQLVNNRESEVSSQVQEQKENCCIMFLRSYFNSIFFIRLIFSADSIKNKQYEITKHFFFIYIEMFIDISLFALRYYKNNEKYTDIDKMMIENLTQVNAAVVMISSAIVLGIKILLIFIEKFFCDKPSDKFKRGALICFYHIAIVYFIFIISSYSTALIPAINIFWIICISINLVVDMFIIQPCEGLIKHCLTKICRRSNRVGIS